MTVDFETAKMLKDAGYNETTDNFYQVGRHDMKEPLLWRGMPYNHNDHDNEYAVPTYEQVTTWLRESKWLHVHGYYSWHKLKWGFIMQGIENMLHQKHYAIHVTHDTALLAAIKHALNHLKKGK